MEFLRELFSEPLSFEAITKDKEGIFANPNPPADMTGMGKVDTGDLDKYQSIIV